MVLSTRRRPLCVLQSFVFQELLGTHDIFFGITINTGFIWAIQPICSILHSVKSPGGKEVESILVDRSQLNWVRYYTSSRRSHKSLCRSIVF